MTKPILLLDIDSVLVETNHINMNMVNAKFGTNYRYEDISDFGYSFLKPKHRRYVYDVCWQDPSLYDNIELSQETLVALEHLRKLVRVVACSYPLIGHIQSKYAFLSRHFNHEDITLVKDKNLVNGSILVDDSPDNVESFQRTAIVFDRPWNQELTDYPRVHNFPEIYNTVKELLA